MEEVEGKNYTEAITLCMVKEESSISVYLPLQGKKVGGYTLQGKQQEGLEAREEANKNFRWEGEVAMEDTQERMEELTREQWSQGKGWKGDGFYKI